MKSLNYAAGRRPEETQDGTGDGEGRERDGVAHWVHDPHVQEVRMGTVRLGKHIKTNNNLIRQITDMCFYVLISSCAVILSLRGLNT